VRGHVVVAFGRVDEQRISVGDEPREEGIEVTAHVGIRVFAHD
jgi:hypothetical protein